MEEKPKCHECGSLDLHEFHSYKELSRVTSDCKPWRAGGRLSLCTNCGLLQAPVTPDWLAECERIYQKYSVYYQSGGIEQAVFDPGSGKPMRRSEKLVRQLTTTVDLPEQGRMLDAGCGNGGFLKACTKVLTKWEFAGAELSNKYRDEVLQIPRVKEFFAMNLLSVPCGFDAISMIHLLEHVPNPGTLLKGIGEKLKPDGFVFVQVPTPVENPFELLIADHCSHFTAESLQRLVSRSELQHVNRNSLGWLSKELSLVAKPGSPAPYSKLLDCDEQISRTETALAWLQLVMNQGIELAKDRPIAIFGTSIAANWIVGCLGEERVAYFVDEDPSRENTTLFGKPVHRPENAPTGIPIFVPLAPRLAASVQERLAELDLVIPDTAMLD